MRGTSRCWDANRMKDTRAWGGWCRKRGFQGHDNQVKLQLSPQGPPAWILAATPAGGVVQGSKAAAACMQLLSPFLATGEREAGLVPRLVALCRLGPALAGTLRRPPRRCVRGSGEGSAFWVVMCVCSGAVRRARLWGSSGPQRQGAGAAWFTGTRHDPFRAPCGKAAPSEAVSGCCALEMQRKLPGNALEHRELWRPWVATGCPMLSKLALARRGAVRSRVSILFEGLKREILREWCFPSAHHLERGK